MKGSALYERFLVFFFFDIYILETIGRIFINFLHFLCAQVQDTMSGFIYCRFDHGLFIWITLLVSLIALLHALSLSLSLSFSLSLARSLYLSLSISLSFSLPLPPSLLSLLSTTTKVKTTKIFLERFSLSLSWDILSLSFRKRSHENLPYNSL